MNKVFRLVWNRHVGQLVVASEAARARRKDGGATGLVGSLHKSALAVLFSMAAVGGAVTVSPAYGVQLGGGIDCTTDDGKTRLAVGTDARACWDFATAIGSESKVNGEYGTALGRSAFAKKSATGLGVNATAWDYAVAVGSQSEANPYGVAVGRYADAGDSAVAVGRNASAVSDAIAVGRGSTVTSEGSVAIGQGSDAGNVTLINEQLPADVYQRGVALGKGASAVGSVALGHNAKAGKPEEANSGAWVGTAIGAGAQALAHRGIAIGSARNRNTYASGTNAVAMGNAVKARGNNSIAIGNSQAPEDDGTWTNFTRHRADGVRAVALGYSSQADGDNSITLGAWARATDHSSMALGREATANNDGAMALGSESQASGYRAIAQGVQSTSTGNSSIAQGREAKADNDGAIALGPASQASGYRAVAQGAYSAAGGERAIAIGAGAESSHTDSVALGSGSVADGGGLANAPYQPVDVDGNLMAVAAPTASSEVSVGDVGGERRITNVAAGSADTDAVNVSQLAAVDTKADYASQGWNLSVAGGGSTNVAPGGTVDFVAGNNVDIVRNGNQLTFSAAGGTGGGSVHYYSVNDGGTQQSNYYNGGAVGVDSLAAGTEAYAQGASSTAVGDNTYAQQEGTVAIGRSAGAYGTNHDAGQDTYLYDRGNPYHYQTGNGEDIGEDAPRLFPDRPGRAVSIGKNTESRAGGVALGSDAYSHNFGVALGASAKVDKIAGMAIGPSAWAGGNTSLAIGRQSAAVEDFAQALGNQAAAKGRGSFAVGHSAVAEGSRSIAIGTADLDSAGDTDHQSGVLWAEQGRTEALGQDAVAIASGAVASADETIAIGTDAIASGIQSISIGTANEVSGDASGAIGEPNIVTGAGSYALGNDNTIDADEAGAFGNRNMLAGTADGSRIIGNDSNVDVADAFVMGNGADVTVAEGVSLGNGSIADTGAGIQGYNPITGAADGLDPAIAATASTTGAVAVGDAYNGVYRQITGVAAGTEDSDAVNVAQLKSVSDVANAGWDISAQGENATNVAPGETVDLNNDDGNIVVSKTADSDDVTFDLADNVTIGDSLTVEGDTHLGDNFEVVNNEVHYDGPITDETHVVNKEYVDGVETHYYSVNDGGVPKGNYDNDGATGLDSMAAGVNASAVEAGGVAIGKNATSLDRNAVAMGLNAEASHSASLALGQDSEASGQNSIAMGIDAKATGIDGIAIGNATDAVESSTALGDRAAADLLGSVAIGQQAHATDQDSVALGSFTQTSEAVGTSNVTIDGMTYDFAGTDPLATVSVGSDSYKRTITNVAAGRVSEFSTDAINGSQLFATNKAIENVSETANAGWNLSTQDGAASNVAPDGEVNLRNADGNLAISQVTNNGREEVTFDLADNVTIGDSLTVEGDTTVNGDTYLGDNFEVVNNEAHYDGPITEDTHVVNKKYVDDSGDELIAEGLNFSGNEGETVHRDLGETLAVTGEATAGDTYSGANLKTVTDPATGEIALQMSDQPQFGDVTINEGDSGKITGLAPGEDGTDAVNVDQLEEVSDVANTGWDISAQGENASNVAPGETVDLNNADGNIVVSKTADSDDVTFDLADNVTIGDSLTVEGDTHLGDNFEVVNNEAIYNVEPDQITNDYEVVNKKYVDQSGDDIVNTGFNITADNADLTDPAATEDNVKLGETVAYTSEDGSIVTTVKDNEVDLALGSDLSVGGPGADGEDGEDGYIGVDGKDGETGVGIDGSDGSIGLTGPAGADGKSPELTMRPTIEPG
ncbi:ESPR-type extended signal peptide-containing protein, partial [Halomonas sp. I1]|uniref:ESPR-type extended signal peptide-containing protein n=1 Tax=Halomonas sp. I1 TaxID=393536 RepID=UPI0028DFF763